MRRRSSASIIQWNGDSEHFVPSPTGNAITCLVDSVKMEQVLNNLISYVFHFRIFVKYLETRSNILVLILQLKW